MIDAEFTMPFINMLSVHFSIIPNLKYMFEFYLKAKRKGKRLSLHYSTSTYTTEKNYV